MRSLVHHVFNLFFLTEKLPTCAGLRHRFCLILLSGLATAASAQCPGNLITNGSLETDWKSPSNFNTTFQGTPASHDASNGLYVGGSYSFPLGWDYMDGGGYYLNGGDAQDGTRFVYVKGAGQCFNRVVTTTPCRAYLVRFYAASFTPSGAQGPANFLVHYQFFKNNSTSSSNAVGAEPEVHFSAPASTGWNNLNWQEYYFLMMAPAGTTNVLLYFSSNDNTDGICFDNFCITDATASMSNYPTNNGPACGSPLTLSMPVTNGTYMWPGTPEMKFSWSGPNGFSSTQQNPTVTNTASMAHNGTYSVTVTSGPNGHTCSFTGSTVVNVNCSVSCPGNKVSNPGFEATSLGNSTFAFAGGQAVNFTTETPDDWSAATGNGGNYWVNSSKANSGNKYVYTYSSGTTNGSNDACNQQAPIALQGNTCYTLCVYAADAKADGLASGLALEVYEKDGNGNPTYYSYKFITLPNNPAWSDNALTTIPWQQYCYTFTTKPNTTNATLWLSATADVGGPTSYIVLDDVCLSPATVDIVSATPGTCNPAYNTYSVAVQVSYQNSPGLITVTTSTGQSGTLTTAPGATGSGTVTITGLPANGAMGIDLTASFSDTNQQGGSSCTDVMVDAFNAPVACSAGFCEGNLLQNGSFEQTVGAMGSAPASWTVGNGGIALTSASLPVPDGMVMASIQHGTLTQCVPATAGHTYQLEFRDGTQDPSFLPSVELRFYNAGNTQVGAAVVHTITNDIDLTNHLEPFPYTLGAHSLVATAPAGAVSLCVIVRDPSPGAATVRVDAACLTEIPLCTLTASAIAGACNTSTNQYTLSGTLTFVNPPATGSLTVSVAGGGTQTFSAPFSAPVAYTISGLLSDGAMHTVTAVFSADPACVASQAYVAPAACQCSITALNATTQCQDQNTGNPADDRFSLTINPAATNAGVQYTVTVIQNGVSSGFGPFNFGTATTLGNFLISAGSLTVTVASVSSPACTLGPVTVNAPAACSACAITALHASTDCDSQNTPAPADDRFTVTLNPTHTGLGAQYNVTVVQNGVTTTYGPFNYGAPTTFGNFLISSGGLTVSVADAGFAGCNLSNQSVAAPASCSSCSITALNASTTCDDQNTSSAGDDRFTLTLNPAHAGPGAQYNVVAVQNGVTYNFGPLPFGTASTMGNFLITAGALSVSVSEVSGACTFGPATVAAPSACSVCSITALNATTTCNDQSTPNQGDDRFSLTLDPTHTGLGIQYMVTVVQNGATSSFGPLNYGAPTTIGNFLIGAGNLSVSVAEFGNSGCALGPLTVAAPTPCSPPCSITALNASTTCDNLNTPSAADDRFALTLDPSGVNTGSLYNVVVVQGGITYNFGPLSFGAAQTMGSFLISAGGLSVTVMDAATPSCSFGPQTVAAPAACSTCSISALNASTACNDQGTGAPGDDRFTLTLNPAHSGLGMQYSVTVVQNGVTTNFGNFNYGAPTTLGNFLIGNGNLTVTVADATSGACNLGPQTVAAPAPCSVCSISGLNAAVFCHDQNTGTPADDRFTLTLNPTHAGLGSQYLVSILQNGVALSYGPFLYGSTTVMGDFLISAGGLVVTVTDAATGTCVYGPEVVAAPAACSVCNITAINPITACNNQETADPADDTYSLTVNPDHDGLGSQYLVTVLQNGLTFNYGPFDYGVAAMLGNYFIADGALSVTVTDAAASTCVLGPQIVAPPATCSDCSIGALNAVTACQNQSTANPGDDRFTLTLNPSHSGVGTQYNVTVVQNGSTFTYGPLNYGAPTTLGNFLIAAGNLQVSVADASGAVCNLGPLTVPPPATCSSCSITALNASTGCDDVNTANPADDRFTLTLAPSHTGVGTQYNVVVVQNGVTFNFGPLPYNVPTTMGNFLIASGNLQVSVSDASGASCNLGPITVSAPAACSACAITAMNPATDCDNQNTANLLDDRFSLTLNPTHTGIGSQYTVTVVQNGVTYTFGPLNYGVATTVGNFLISAGNLSVTLGDASGGGACTLGPLTIAPPATCSDCAITALHASAQCTDQNTGSPADDRFTLTVNPDHTGVGTDYILYVVQAGTAYTFGPLNYGAPVTVGNFLITDGDLSITAVDASGMVCSLGNQLVAAPEPCSIPAKIGDFVWEDLNGNGVQDGGEPGIPGVPVVLTGVNTNGAAITISTVTDGTGMYMFGGLDPGIYKVTFGQLAGYLPSPVDRGGNDANDSDAGPFLMSPNIVVLPGDNIPTIDAGFYQPAKIGNYVWEDLNGDGLQQGNEPGIAGVTVVLSGNTGGGAPVNLVATTDGTGMYMFGNLAPGSYKLTFTTPFGGYVPTPANQGSNDAMDSDAALNSGMTVYEDLISGENNPDYDAGYYLPCSIGNYVWHDLDADGIQDENEPGIGGVTVTLTGITGNGLPVTQTTTTNGAGFYQFLNLPPGTYKITFGTPAGGYIATHANDPDAPTDADDSDADPSMGGMTVNEVLTSGEYNPTYDAGFYLPASIGNFVWQDQNGNGIQDPGEPGIPGVMVTLTGTDGQGNPVTLTTTTNGSGGYNFPNLIPGSYKLTFNTPAGYTTTPLNLGGSDGIDSDADPAMNGMTVFEDLISGENNPDYDAGYYQPASIGNFVWNDLNANGIQDPGEPGIPGVTVVLTGTDGAGNPVDQTLLTDATGFYQFTNLAPGSYKLSFQTPAGGFVPTQVDDPQATDATDSDANPAMGGMTVFETLVSGENNPNYDAGYFIPAKIGDYVWEDLNANGVQDTGEPGIVGATVTLTGTDGQGNPITQTTTTGTNGMYMFGNLMPGTYKLTFATPPGYDAPTYLDQGGNDAIDSDANPAMGGMTVNEVLISGENNPNYDAGFYAYASIGDFVWEDYNADGEQDAGEPGIAGVTVTLTGTTGNGTPVTLTTTTNGSGFYLFPNLIPGNYKLTFTTPAGYQPTLLDTPSGNDAADSDANPAIGGMTVVENLVSNEDNLSYDAGYFSTDYGDLPNSYGTTNAANGAHHVLNPNLLLGACADAEPNGQPDPMAGMTTGGDDNTTGAPVKGLCGASPDDENGISFETPLVPGYPACIRVNVINTTGAPAVLQGWMDFNGDGDVLDAGEELQFSSNGAIPTGGVINAQVCFNVPANATFAGGMAFARFRLSPAGGLGPLGRAIGGEVEDYKLPLGKIGNLVWNDLNFNGIQNQGEPGIAGVNVSLTWAGPDGNINTAADNLVYNTTTGLAGLYYFCGLTNGTYKITVLSPALMTPTRANQGGSDMADSDGPVVNMDLTMVMETFTLANVTNLPTGENSTGDLDGAGVNGFPDPQTDETHDFGFAFLDYGDLPQETQGGQSYNTTMAELGAVHAASKLLTLGRCVDAEREGQPDDDSGIYDQQTNDTGDGDDGGQGYAISSQSCAGASFGTVSAGSYSCNGNMLIVRQLNAFGKYVYYVVNGDYTPQIAQAGGLGNLIGREVIVTGTPSIAPFGGNAAALIACLAQADGINTGLITIGGMATVSFACFDIPQNCSDDEDGIVFETPLIPTFEACLRVTATNATGAPAVLQGWIDWNGNKQLDAGEALTFSNGGLVPAGGVNNAPYCFTVPAGAVFNAGRVYARFRLSPGGGLTADGPDKYGTAALPLGEVEDYIKEVGMAGNLVWEDRNFDGLQGNPLDEPGLNGVPVTLMWAGPDGNLATTADNRSYTLPTATLNGKNGLYYFLGLIEGSYKLTAAAPAGFMPTLVNQGNDDQLDADDFGNGDVFTFPDVTSLALSEHGVSDMPGMIPNFPDSHDDQTHDMGFAAMDFSDNPDSYSTTLMAGARHTIVPGLYLGMGVDAEGNGQPDPLSGVTNSGGDDGGTGAYSLGMVVGGDDEDGVRMLTPFIPGYEACMEVKTTVQAPNTGAFLSAWIDFAGDGIYQSADKVLFTTIDGATVNSQAPAVPQGVLTRKYCFNVVSTASFAGGAADMRFRLSNTPVMGATGLVISGEVEDYWQPLAIVGNYAWMDADLAGDQDAGEMALPNVPMQLRWWGEDATFNTVDDRLYNTSTDASGAYLYRGLIPGSYRVTPLKYTGVANPNAVAPLNKILTVPNQAPANDNNDSDAAPFIPVTVPNLITNFLPLSEDGQQDNNGQNLFPDKQENLSLDVGFIDLPNLAGALGISGVAKASSGTCGHFDVILDLCVKNTGGTPLNMLQATLDLSSPNAFGAMFLGFVPGGAPQILSSNAQQNPVLNGAYNGGNNLNLFNGTSGLLWPGEQICLRLRFELNPTAAGAPANPDVQALLTGKAVNFQGVPIPDFNNGGMQYMLSDLSDDGNDPASTNPFAPGDTGGTNDPTPLTNCWDISQPLVENDLVYVSVDSSCQVLILADMVLEGEAENCLENIYPQGGYYKVTVKTLQGVIVPNPVPASFIGQTLKVEVEHIVSCNKTWGLVKLEDKLPPILTCPPPITVACSEDLSPAHTGQVQVHDCSTFTLVIDDEYTDFGLCSSPRAQLLRTWIVTDSWHNQASCSQVITIVPFDLNEVVFPPDLTLDCETAYLNPAATAPANAGSPSINGASILGSIWCGAKVNYTDTYYQGCPGTYTILRNWSVQNDCLPLGGNNPVSHVQRIIVNDFGGPVFACPPAVTVSTDPFYCCATAPLPDMIVSEGCSHILGLEAKITGADPNTGNIITFTVGGYLADFPGNNWWNPDTLAVFPYTQCLPLGDYTVRYTASDECGNTSSCNFVLTVRDLVPPVAVCDEFTQVALGVNGEATVFAATFDDGSHDNCCLDSFLVRRMAESPCDQDTLEEQFAPTVLFCCADINDTITVVFRATDCHGNSNDCMVQVFVEDKIKPACQSPANLTVSCENFDPSLWVYGLPAVSDNCCLDSTKVYQNQIGLTHTVSYTQFDSLCNRGTITRNFRAHDCAGLSSQCTQRIVVTYEQDYFVHFPDDKIVTVCDGTGTYGEPSFLNDQDCELLGVSYEDVIYTVVPDACYKIERSWTIINWCTYNPNLPCIEVPNPNPNATVNHPSNLPGPIVSAAGTPAPWNPTIVKINPTDPAPTNYSIFYDPNANCYKYKQIIKILDTQDPVIDCPASPVEFCDGTANDPLFWNEMYWWDNVTQSHDRCEAPTDLTITASDLCSGADLQVRYLLFLDLDGDGTMETVISSSNLPGFNTVNYNNYQNQNFGGGTPRAFDGRPVPNNQKYGFALQTTVSGSNKVAAVRWNTQQSPGSYTIPQLPYGTHKIKWIVADGCGNESVCEYTFIVKDCKKPTVVCLNGLSVNIMPTGMITLWASDFLQYTEDNCTPSPLLKTAIVKSAESSGTFPVDGNGNPVTGITFTCAELGTQPVQLWSIDLAGNADFCETYVIVQDNMGNCGSNANVAGALKTEAGQGLEEGTLQLEGTHPALPPVSMFGLSDNAGAYAFSNAVPMAGNYTLTPTDDDNPLNGVTTFDLVLMSKHILGTQPLASPYQQIAADINKSGSITTYDVVELRKLILGIYTELPYNSSWRFVDKAFDFPNPANAFETAFPESRSVADVQGNQLGNDFVAVKIGDVNGSALPNSLVQADDRSAGTLFLDLQDRELKAGEVFEVTLRTDRPAQGFQFTLNLNGLEVRDLPASADGRVSAANFGNLPGQRALTVSIDGADAFTVEFRATKSGKLSDMLGISSRITRAEGYSAAGERLETALRFNSPSGVTTAGVGFELYQNQPNPFVRKTLIGFHLPEATRATLTVCDETGRVLLTRQGDFGKGYNAIAVERDALPAAGLLYYKLETGTDSATRKMIQVR